MRVKLISMFPQTLRNRLFLAFVLLIVLPHAFLNFYYFNRVEVVLRKQTADQSLEQIGAFNKSFEDLLNVAYKTVTLLEQDVSVADVLQRPERYDQLNRVYLMDAKFKSIINSLFISSPPVYFTLLDQKGSAYASFTPHESLSYTRLSQEPWYDEALSRPYGYVWKLDRNYVNRDISRSPNLLTISALLKDGKYARYAVARVSVDFYEWFRSATRFAQEQYLLVDRQGTIIADSKSANAGQTKLIHHSMQILKKGYFVEGTSLYIFNEIPRLDMFMVKRMPMDVIYAEVNRLKRSFFTASVVFTAAFVAMTRVISSTITKPLYNLQRKMAHAVEKNFLVQLPEDKYRGEVLQLTKTFNKMLGDIHELIGRLKTEERKKEAVRFQALLSQTNPHFLMNTLNTVKWLAIGKGQEEIAEICSCLGRLLEASVNSELDMIYLKDEMDLVQSFVYIQNFRYKQKFDLNVQIGEGLEYALVPKLSLQPLVENSIQHGFMEMEGRGTITIRVYAKDRMIYLEVEDNGAGLKNTPSDHAGRKRGGIGISNLKERLALLFKDFSGLELVKLEQGTLVRFYFPLLLSTPYTQEVKRDVDGIARGG